MYDGMDLRRLDECWLPSDRALNLCRRLSNQSQFAVYNVKPPRTDHLGRARLLACSWFPRDC